LFYLNVFDILVYFYDHYQEQRKRMLFFLFSGYSPGREFGHIELALGNKTSHVKTGRDSSLLRSGSDLGANPSN
jgi:hypothetical protein